MIEDFDKIFNKIKETNLFEESKYIFEIDLENLNIIPSPKIENDNSYFSLLKNKLPPSFIFFIETIANGLYINIGNALTIFPIDINFRDYWNRILSLEDVEIDGEIFPSNDFLFFGADGCGQLFAFYTAFKFESGEFPIVRFTSGLADSNPFVLLNSSFDKFLTIQYYLLRATDFEEKYSSEKVLELSIDLNWNKLDEANWQRFQDELYNKYDQIIPKPNIDLSISPLTLKQLKKEIEQLLK
jgi:hypothetical protein